ncbi:hypothetical protein, partial [Agrobacterium salinitolerans]|uniref:hypothetical protein n=1 Tax=Agrobacterium salinitolerans TaxID=1183413 RepID=UPI00196AC592
KTTTKRHHPEKEKTRRKYRRVCQRSEPAGAILPVFVCQKNADGSEGSRRRRSRSKAERFGSKTVTGRLTVQAVPHPAARGARIRHFLLLITTGPEFPALLQIVSKVCCLNSLCCMESFIMQSAKSREPS